MKSEPKPAPDQMTKFRDLARKLECDDDEAAFDERLKKLAKASRPKAGYWRVDFALPHGHRANFYPANEANSWLPGPIFSTPQEVEAWLTARGCRPDKAIPSHWLDQ
jgi:hypothetical protein